MDIEKIKIEIYALYDECLATKIPFHRKIDLFIVPETTIETVMKATGIDLSEHWVCIDNYGIIHTLEHHSNPIAEAKRGQIAVEKEDFIRFLDVFFYPDDVNISR